MSAASPWLALFRKQQANESKRRGKVMNSAIYIVERVGCGRFDRPELVDVYKIKNDAISFIVKKNSNANSKYFYSYRMKKLK